MGDRIQLRWRFWLRRPDEPEARVIEQTAYAKVVDGAIAVIDMVCSGFRPVSVPLLVKAA